MCQLLLISSTKLTVLGMVVAANRKFIFCASISKDYIVN